MMMIISWMKTNVAGKQCGGEMTILVPMTIMAIYQVIKFQRSNATNRFNPGGNQCDSNHDKLLARIGYRVDYHNNIRYVPIYMKFIVNGGGWLTNSNTVVVVVEGGKGNGRYGQVDWLLTKMMVMMTLIHLIHRYQIEKLVVFVCKTIAAVTTTVIILT